MVALLLLGVLRHRFATSRGAQAGEGTGGGGRAGSSLRRGAYTLPAWAAPVPRLNPVDEPYCVRYLRYETPDSEPGSTDRGDEDHNTCLEPFQVGEDDTGIGA